MYVAQTHLSYHYPAQIQTLGKGSIMLSIYLLSDFVCSEHISFKKQKYFCFCDKKQKYFCFWIQFWNMPGNVMEMRLVQDCVGCLDLCPIVLDLKTFKG